MKVFCASIATETNTFSPLRTDLSDFHESFYAPPGQHPQTPTLCSAVFPELRMRARRGEIELVEGTATWAEPAGLVSAQTWAHLRDEVLGQLRAAMPVQAVVLGLHGAMIAQDCVDCEGELLAEIRKIVGPDVKIGASFDPHSHLSAARVDNADIITVFKEFPHTDFVEAGVACVDLTLRAARGEIRPVISVFDVRMIDVLPTSRAPMRGFVDRMRALEDEGAALSLSVIHGFMAGDSPDLGVKMVVITDDAQAAGDALARKLGQELFTFRGRARPDFMDPAAALDRVAKSGSWPVVLADVWDNPGGGVPGDSTIILRQVLDMGLRDIAFGTIWDPMAARICHAAGEGAQLKLRFGGKTSDVAGDPVDAVVRVVRVQRDAVQSFGASVVPLGDSAVIEFQGVQVVLNSTRSQAFSPDLFTNLGIDIAAKRALVVKSTNHFHGAFAPVASEILYCAVDGPYPNDPRRTDYKHLTRAIWPRVDDPHGTDGNA
ncbi:M81 family metallopeptidase [Roseinatronobacter sp.]|uniref:M81 family metallopeptidase n=1 Tax=Roseinatronobacter sp. TaxID=1945755 RepID=UPI003F71E89E